MKNILLVVARIICLFSPKLSTRLLYRAYFKKKLDFNNPQTLNEKILWLKFHTYYNNRLITDCADKFRVREYISQKGLGNLLIDVIQVHDSFKTIDFKKLPQEFIAKCNHAAGYNLVCRNKESIEPQFFLHQIKKWYKNNFWMRYAEIHYKPIKRKILIEKLLLDKYNSLPKDYKFYCFNGKPEFVMVCEDRETSPHFYYFNHKWELQPLSKDAIVNPQVNIVKPDRLDDMFKIAAILSQDFVFVRVDLYYLDNKIYFGELTFTPSSGLDVSRLTDTDRLFGRMLKLEYK